MAVSGSASWFGAYDRYSINRFRPLLLAMQVVLFFVGCLFWINAWLGLEGFNPWTFGMFAYSFPAELWAASMMGGSSMCVMGLIKPVQKWMVVVGSAILSFIFLLFSYSAIFTGGEFVVGIFSSNFFLTFHLWLTIEASRGT